MGRLSKPAMATGAAILFLLAACSPVGGGTAPSGTSPTSGVVRPVTPACTAAQFADGVYVIPAGKPFDFLHNGGSPYAPPTAQAGQTLGALKGSIPLYMSVDNGMVAAFSIAPPYLQAALCTLMANKGVFIDTADKAAFGWSFWEVAGQLSGTGRYIAVGKKVWTSGANLAALENVILQLLLQSPGTQNITGSGATVTSTVEQPITANGPTNVAVLAVLAREVGLMLYNDYIDPTNPYLKSTPCTSPSLTGLSWSSVTSTLTQTQKIEDESSTTARSYVRPSKIRANENQNPPNIKADSDAFRLVFTGNAAGPPAATMPEWADAAAYTKPSNDFAETFRLAAEAYVNPTTNQPNVSAIKIPFPNATNNQPVDLIANLNLSSSSVLQSKLACILNNQSVWANP